MKSKIILLLISFMFLLSFTSCDKYKLTTEEATDIISKTELYESYAFIDLKIFDLNAQKLQNAGYLNLINPANQIFKIEPTSKGKEYFLGEQKNENTFRFKLFTETFDKVIGIAIDKEKGTAIVKYSTRINNTPIGETLSKTGKSQTLEVEFKKFDTGWQVEIPVNNAE